MTLPRLRVASLLLGLLWLSGLAWMLGQALGSQATPFGAQAPPWLAPLARAHGIASQAALLVLGWAWAHHARGAPPRPRTWRRRVPGALVVVLVAAGCLQLFVTGEVLLHALSLLHRWLGLALGLALSVHLWGAWQPRSRVSEAEGSRGRGRGGGHGRGHPARSARS